MESITSLINAGSAESAFRAQELIRHRLTIASLRAIDEVRREVASDMLGLNDADVDQENKDN